jgi:hypothetical protein
MGIIQGCLVKGKKTLELNKSGLIQTHILFQNVPVWDFSSELKFSGILYSSRRNSSKNLG